jgi:proline-specific peptidase
MQVREGRIPVPGGSVWYRRLGPDRGVPLLALHGGPGCGHDYLESLEALADERPVIFFDQLGCGRSDKPDDPSLWRMDRFVEELVAVRAQLDLQRVHLFGQSWGGWLAIEYMVRRPSGIASLTLASTASSVPQVIQETARLKATLPAEVLEVLHRHEADGDYHHPEYEAAMMEFYRRFVCRLDPWPDPLMRTLQNMTEHPIPYETMQGPNEFTFTGNLRNWDRTDQLAEIAVPTLVTCGRHDELGPPCAERLHRGIAGSELRVFERSAHCAHLEEAADYLRVLRDFLGRADAESVLLPAT